jgi:hypothetical protein
MFILGSTGIGYPWSRKRTDQFYPMVIHFNRDEILVSSPDALAERLRGIFSANETRKVIGTLIAQSKAMAS